MSCVACMFSLFDGSNLGLSRGNPFLLLTWWSLAFTDCFRTQIAICFPFPFLGLSLFVPVYFVCPYARCYSWLLVLCLSNKQKTMSKSIRNLCFSIFKNVSIYKHFIGGPLLSGSNALEVPIRGAIRASFFGWLEPKNMALAKIV
jgi:hypothetical protein